MDSTGTGLEQGFRAVAVEAEVRGTTSQCDIDLGPDVRLDCEAVEHLSDAAEIAIRRTVASAEAMSASREALRAVIGRGDEVYGLTTGFGPFVAFDAHTDPQRQGIGLLNHLRAGWGASAEDPVVRACMFIRAQCMAQGRSGVSDAAFDGWCRMIEAGICPVTPAIGSVGASGDLCPLAHMAGALAGEGRSRVRGEERASGEWLSEFGIEPVALSARDALGIVNGTSFMSAYAAIAIARAKRLIDRAERLTGWLYALLGATRQHLDHRLHEARGQFGQIDSAARIMRAFEGTTVISKALEERPLQEVYSIRCAPQILGACREQLNHARRLVESEINGVNDNPVICSGPEPAAVHGGNFQGQQIAFAADALNSALVQAAVLAERQLDVILNPELNGGAPLLLAWEPGADSGMAGAQITATALVAEMRHRGGPVATTSIPTNGRNQDIVSMGTLAAREAFGQTGRLAAVLGILGIGAWRLGDLRKHDRARGNIVMPPAWIGVPDSFDHDIPLRTAIEAAMQSVIQKRGDTEAAQAA